MDNEARLLASVGAELGEGPVWSARDKALWFVDIKAPCVYRYDPASHALDRFDAPSHVGWILPAQDGLWVAGLAKGLHRFDPRDGSFTLMNGIEAELRAAGQQKLDAAEAGQELRVFGYRLALTLPLPLGVNVARRDVERLHDLSAVLREAIDRGLEHRAEALEYALQFGRGIDAAVADRFVSMYVNDLTQDYGDEGRSAVQELLRRGEAIGAFESPVNVDFVS